MRKPLIFEYDKMKGTEYLVDISNVCYKDNLYELKDNFGKICDSERNMIENSISRLEYGWDKTINRVIREEELNEDDINLMYSLVVLQILRMPDIIDFSAEWIYKTYNTNIGYMNKQTSERYAKMSMFPSGKMEPEKNWAFNCVKEFTAKNTQLVIYKSNTPFILNDNQPVLFLPLSKTSNVPFYLPITSNHCLGIIRNINSPLYIDISDNMVRLINNVSFNAANRFVYSSKSILKGEI